MSPLPLRERIKVRGKGRPLTLTPVSPVEGEKN